MVTKELLLKRLDELAQSLRSGGKALGLLALGSCGLETERLDKYSDLDFFVICKDGTKEGFLRSPDWLEAVAPLAFWFMNTGDGYKAMYRDGVFVECAVFEPRELKNIPYPEGRWHWRDPSLDEALANPQGPVPQPKEPKQLDIQWTVGEMLTNLWVGLGRFHRGELLSSQYFVQSYAVDRFLDLWIAHKGPGSTAQDGVTIDPFGRERRLEQRYPELEAILREVRPGYGRCPQGAAKLLGYSAEITALDGPMVEAVEELIKA